MPFPTTSLLDDFNRADANPATGWTDLPASVAPDGIQTASNQAKSSVAGNFFSAYYNATTFSGNLEARIQEVTFSTVGVGIALYVRLQNIGTGTTDGYYAQIFKAAGTDEVKFYRLDNDVFTQLGAAESFEAQGWFGLSHTDSGSLTVYTGAASSTMTAVATRTDSTYTGAGYLGLGGASDGGNTEPIMDNYGGGTTVGARRPTTVRPAPFTPGLAR